MEVNVPVGLVRKGRVKKFNIKTGEIDVEIESSSATSEKIIKSVKLPISFYSSSGAFIGSIPENNTAVVIAQSNDTKWYVVNFLIDDLQYSNLLTKDAITLKSAANTAVTISKDDFINIGFSENRLNIDNKRNIINSKFNDIYSFSSSGLKVEGLVRRDLDYAVAIDEDSKLYLNKLNDLISIIPFDSNAPVSYITRGQTKNPPLVEQRSLTYEFALDSNILDDHSENSQYGNGSKTLQKYNAPNRKNTKFDTMSLSLFSPNYLMEKVTGNVVDIFGNLLDLNRFPIKSNYTIKNTANNNTYEAFAKIKQQQRRGLAYHFELNARKDLSNTTTSLPDLNSKSDYSKTRSRMFLDFDKEGQFKLNIPASSETGNIPLLVRYENYSYISSEDNNNPNKWIKRDDKLDILHDSFNIGYIQLKNDEAEGSIKDRITDNYITHGMMYNDISKICLTHQSTNFINYQYSPSIDLSSFPSIGVPVSKFIYTDGPKANAGGRSGSLNIEGSLEFNLGANTVDRQSLWLNTAGGILGAIGRDKNNISAGISMSGDLLLEVGGYGINSDSRFKTLNNGYRGGAIDIRVLNPGFTATAIRIDNEGVKIMSPQMISIHAKHIQMIAERCNEAYSRSIIS